MLGMTWLLFTFRGGLFESEEVLVVIQKWIFWFDELGQEHNNIVGKKCANLGEMTRIGIPVPPGFALSLEAYKRFFKETNASREIQEYLNQELPENIKEWEQASKAIMQIVESKEMPKSMAESISSDYEELCDKTNIPEVTVSTRSAGTVSRPGQYSTFLNIRGKSNLLEKIIKVWASSFNTRSLMHRAESDLPLESDPIGVAVVKMVNARCAGVTFTAMPHTGDTTKLMSEANWGLGESVVSGRTTPDSYILDKESLEILENQL
jgi:pyruvate,water dikinase